MISFFRKNSQDDLLVWLDELDYIVSKLGVSIQEIRNELKDLKDYVEEQLD